MTPYAALIPIKDHSERVPGKNFRPFAGRPLWQHVVATLCDMPEIGRVYIDTDSTRFTPDVLRAFPKVSIIVRPPELRGDFVSTNRLFAHDLTLMDPVPERILQTHVTNPLLTAKTIRHAMRLFDGALETGAADSLFSVTAYHSRFYTRDRKPVNHDPGVLIRTQDLEPLLEENSNLYLFTRESFALTGARIGRKPLLFEMDRLESVDIDDPPTWMLAETLAMRSPDGK